MKNIIIRIGGKAGSGLVTVSDLFAKVAVDLGFHVFSSKDYASQIRGGHNSHTIRIAKEKVNADKDEINILVALDQFSLDKHLSKVSEGGTIFFNTGLKFEESNKINFVPISVFNIEEKLGQKNLSNAIFFGAVAKCLGISWEACESTIKSYFSHKQNLLKVFNDASLLGYNETEKVFDFTKQENTESLTLISGNDAISFAALKAGLTFHVQYPMTPVTGILHTLSKESVNNKNLTVVQPEDEIAAINMALGASYAGARVMTATSGGGFALMTESLSLAGMAEIPLVIIEGQRPGPATGLPTKTEQGDLDFVVNSGHGDFPLAVIAPSSIEDCYTETKRAFYLAEKYQAPVIVLIDKHLAESIQSVNLEKEENVFTFDYKQKINVVDEVKDSQINKEGLFKRYAKEELGRTLPGTKNGIYTCAGDEHNDVGVIIEDPQIRIDMVHRREEKSKMIREEFPSPELIGSEDAELTVVSWGSNFGAINEVRNLLKDEGKKINFLNLKHLFPFQKEEVKSLLLKAKNLLLIENNFSGQLGKLIAEHTGILIENKCLKFNGQTFTVDEIYQEIKNWWK